MTRPATPLDAARAALAAHEGGDAVAVVMLVAVEPAGAEAAARDRAAEAATRASAEEIDAAHPRPGARLLVREGAAPEGTLGHPALDAAALALAARVHAGDPPGTTSVEAGGLRAVLYAEAVRPPDALLIVGAGHIAVPLAELGARLGFRVTVLDDREGFATAERFPHADAVLRADFSDPFRGVRIGPRTYVVLVTRGHEHDFDCLRRLVEAEHPPRYTGMIGSRRRVRAAFTALLDAGVPRERLARVHAPVGLDLGAETPEEIAVAIAAELVLARRRPAAEPDPATRAARESVLERLLPERTG